MDEEAFEVDGEEDWFGRRRERREREKKECCGGGGFLRMDLPGRGRVTAEDEGDGDGGERAMDERTGINGNDVTNRCQGRRASTALREFGDRCVRR